MKKLFLLFGLLLWLLNFSHAQILIRNSKNTLAVELSNIKVKDVKCPSEKKVRIELYQKLKNEYGKTCSEQNYWYKLSTTNTEFVNRICIKNNEPGIYKAKVMVFYDCEFEQISKNNVSQNFYTNVLNELEPDSQDLNKIKSQKEFLVYPNPTFKNAIAEIDLTPFEQNVDLKLEIYSSIGALVFEKKLVQEKNMIELEMTRFPPGSYTVSVGNEQKVLFSQQIIKIKK